MSRACFYPGVTLYSLSIILSDTSATSVSGTGNFRTLGISSNFLGIEREISSLQDSKIVVLSAPYERSVSYGGGTRKGPKSILAASHYVEFYDEELDRELCRDVGIATLSALEFGRRPERGALDLIYRAVRDLMGKRKFVVTLGGEHTISVATIRAHAERYSDLCVLQFDAHSDLRDTYMGSAFNHACVMARVAEIVDPRRIIQVGIRAQCIEESRFIRERGIRTVYAHEIRRMDGGDRWEDLVLERLTGHVYVTFDVDAFDPSIMPSTGTPEPNGLLWAETMHLLGRVAARKEIVGSDIVELAPVRGVSHPDLTAAKLVYKIMNYAFLDK